MAIGYLKISGFLLRKDPERARHLQKIKAALIKGYSVINFPEDDTYFTNHNRV
jgi:hypothetical protein